MHIKIYGYAPNVDILAKFAVQDDRRFFNTGTCPFSTRALKFIQNQDVSVDFFVVDKKDNETQKNLKKTFNRSTFPIILVDEKLIGGCDNFERWIRDYLRMKVSS